MSPIREPLSGGGLRYWGKRKGRHNSSELATSSYELSFKKEWQNKVVQSFEKVFFVNFKTAFYMCSLFLIYSYKSKRKM